MRVSTVRLSASIASATSAASTSPRTRSARWGQRLIALRQGADRILTARNAGYSGLLLLLLVALAAHAAALAIISAGLLASGAVVLAWERFALAGVRYGRTLGEQRAFAGEDLALLVEIDNHKPLPLPWLEAEDALPTGLEVRGGTLVRSHETDRVRLRQVVPLAAYGRVRLRYTVHCRRRGAYVIGPVHLRSGDPLGFGTRTATLRAYNPLLVYPKIFSLEALGLPALRPFGDAPDPRRLFDDPARFAGVRPYAPHDSPRLIHWKASARLQALHTRVFEPTTSHTLMLYMNLAGFGAGEAWWEAPPDEAVEQVVSAAASVAAWADAQGFHVGLTTNGAAAGSTDELSVAPAGDRQQLVRVLEALARVTSFARTPLDRLLTRDRHRLPWGTTVVVVTLAHEGGVAKEVTRALRDLFQAGHRPTLLLVGEARGAGARGVAEFPAGVGLYYLPAHPPAPAGGE
jgi:uncharacterized protein (DUF58 family)